MTSILCVDKHSQYRSIPGLDLWDKERDAYNFTGNNPVITHAPCQQWSRLKAFARHNKYEKDLAYLCYSFVLTNGGIFEHPAGSSFFDFVGADRKKIISIDQSWFGFPARKRTYLFFHNFKPLTFPLSFDAPCKKVHELGYTVRSRMPLTFCQWLVDCVNPSTTKPGIEGFYRCFDCGAENLVENPCWNCGR